MANGERIHSGHFKNVVALSPDLAQKFKFGDVFQLKMKDLVYIVEYRDRMPSMHRKKIDLLLGSGKECRSFGKRKGELILLRRGK